MSRAIGPTGYKRVRCNMINQIQSNKTGKGYISSSPFVNEELLIECRKLDECTSRKLTEELLGPSLA